MIRKMFSCLLACALLLSLLAVNAGAVSNPNTSKETARTLIPENVATIIATYFLRDAQTIPDNAWSDNTSIPIPSQCTTQQEMCLPIPLNLKQLVLMLGTL